MTQFRSWMSGEYCLHNGGGALHTLLSSTELRAINEFCQVSGLADGGQSSARRGVYYQPTATDAARLIGPGLSEDLWV
jgi:hypothetical protein